MFKRIPETYIELTFTSVVQKAAVLNSARHGEPKASARSTNANDNH